MRIKKEMLVFLLAGLLFGICSCGSKPKQSERIYISVEEFMQYCGQRVEVTTENWQDYFEVVRGPEEEVRSDAGVDIYNYVNIKLRKNCILAEDKVQLTIVGSRNIYTTYTNIATSVEDKVTATSDFEIEVTLEETPIQEVLYPASLESNMICYYDPDGDPYIVNSKGYLDADPTKKCYMWFDTELLSIGCAEASGQVTLLDIPEQAWNVEEEGVRYLCVGTKEEYFRIYELTFQDDYWRLLENLED